MGDMDSAATRFSGAERAAGQGYPGDRRRRALADLSFATRSWRGLWDLALLIAYEYGAELW